MNKPDFRSQFRTQLVYISESALERIANFMYECSKINQLEIIINDWQEYFLSEDNNEKRFLLIKLIDHVFDILSKNSPSTLLSTQLEQFKISLSLCLQHFEHEKLISVFHSWYVKSYFNKITINKFLKPYNKSLSDLEDTYEDNLRTLDNITAENFSLSELEKCLNFFETKFQVGFSPKKSSLLRKEYKETLKYIEKESSTNPMDFAISNKLHDLEKSLEIILKHRKKRNEQKSKSEWKDSMLHEKLVKVKKYQVDLTELKDLYEKEMQKASDDITQKYELIQNIESLGEFISEDVETQENDVENWEKLHGSNFKQVEKSIKDEERRRKLLEEENEEDEDDFQKLQLESELRKKERFKALDQLQMRIRH
eukprot:maker-scaffold_7-snap-gene-11.47-mRNA-1 protein AED:0.00 eAED:0.00 QI:82/1/1/1/1/1/3/177/368